MKTAVDLLLGHRPLEDPDGMASRVLVRHLRARLPPAAGTGPERHRLLDPARADPSDLEVWDSPTAEGRAWTLAHRVGIRELLGLKADATWLQRRVKPVGFHPTDFDVIFLALPAGVAAYSIERGTMDPLCAHDCFAARAYLFPYVHPPCPVQIPAIQPSPMQ